MRTLVTWLLATALVLSQELQAASAPVKYSSSYSRSDSEVKRKSLLMSSVLTPTKQIGLIKKLEFKLIQRRLKQFAAHHFDEGDAPKKNLLSTISLLLGIVGLVALFIPAIGVVGLIAAPAALVVGIIALGKRYNNSKGSRAKAIIGLVLGSLVILMIILAVIIIASSGWGWLLFAGA